MFKIFVIAMIAVIFILVLCMGCCIMASEFDDEMEEYDKKNSQEGDDWLE